MFVVLLKSIVMSYVDCDDDEHVVIGPPLLGAGGVDTTHPAVLGFILDPTLTYSTHIHNISVHAHKPLQIIKALPAT